jgi:magnesium-transporting ATPase (P-type)
MVGNDPGDVPAMRQADLKLATRSGSQVALMQTDIVLLKDSIEVLPAVLVTGQRLVNSVLDTFKLYLGQVLSQILLILVVLILNRGVFPYTATQGGIVSVFTITIPNIVLSAWSAAGMLTGPEMRRLLARFIFPVGFTMPLLAFVVFFVFSDRTPPPEFIDLVTNWFEVDDAGLFYAQLAVTYALIFAGWLRLFFLQPPNKLWVGGAPLRGDRRVVGMVIFTIIVFVVFFSIPIFAYLLDMTWLPYLSDYLLVTLFSLIWAIALSLIWRSGLVDPIAHQFTHPLRFRSKKTGCQKDFSSPSTG